MGPKRQRATLFWGTNAQGRFAAESHNQLSNNDDAQQRAEQLPTARARRPITETGVYHAWTIIVPDMPVAGTHQEGQYLRDVEVNRFLGDVYVGGCRTGRVSLLWLSLSRRRRAGLRLPRFAPRDRAVCRFVLTGFFGLAAVTTVSPVARTADFAPEVLAFYYGWYGNPQFVLLFG